MLRSGHVTTVAVSVSIVSALLLCIGMPYVCVRFRRRRRERRTRQQQFKMQLQRKLDDVTQLSSDDAKYIRGNCIAPPKHLSAPGYIALYTPGTRSYSSFNEFKSEHDVICDASPSPSPAHTPRMRTATVYVDASSGAQRRAHLQMTHRSSSGTSLPTPPDVNHDFLLHAKTNGISVPASPRSVTSASRVNLNSVSVTV